MTHAEYKQKQSEILEQLLYVKIGTSEAARRLDALMLEAIDSTQTMGVSMHAAEAGGRASVRVELRQVITGESK